MLCDELFVPDASKHGRVPISALPTLHAKLSKNPLTVSLQLTMVQFLTRFVRIELTIKACNRNITQPQEVVSKPRKRELVSEQFCDTHRHQTPNTANVDGHRISTRIAILDWRNILQKWTFCVNQLRNYFLQW